MLIAALKRVKQIERKWFVSFAIYGLGLVEGLVFFSAPGFAVELCGSYLFRTNEGAYVSAKTIREIPEQFRASAKCMGGTTEETSEEDSSSKNQQAKADDESKSPEKQPFAKKTETIKRRRRNGPRLAKPQDIQLEGTIRREEISSSIGKIHLRWPRSVEVLFGRTPLRAMVEAARAVARTLRQSRFPAELKNMALDWHVVFMDEKLPITQIPTTLITNCHPGWMTPPSNIYIVAQRVAAGCGPNSEPNKTSVADAELARVLVHEIGHAVEFQLLRQHRVGKAWKSEGFARWFERFAARYSSMLDESALKSVVFAVAKKDLKRKPYRTASHFDFDVTAFGYARASMYIDAIVQRAGVGGLMRVYEEMANNRTNFASAVWKEIGWSEKRFNEEVAKLILKH